MKTLKNNKKNKKNKTNKSSYKKSVTKKQRSHTTPSLKILHTGFSLFASKKYNGNEVLEYTKNQELKKHNSCLLDNLSWFGSYEVAKSYKTKETKIYEWKIKKNTKLLIINQKNGKYFEKLFKNTNQILTPTIHLTKEQMSSIHYYHPYIFMSPNEKAYYEFCFAFGYITTKEQFQFLELVKYLIKEKYIIMETREGTSIIEKLNLKIAYYRLNILKKQTRYNRLSFYYFDKYALMNLCKIVTKEISGIFQPNINSFWFPNFVVYKMNIEETILFNPHHNLVYEKEVEN